MSNSLLTTKSDPKDQAKDTTEDNKAKAASDKTNAKDAKAAPKAAGSIAAKHEHDDVDVWDFFCAHVLTGLLARGTMNSVDAAESAALAADAVLVFRDKRRKERKDKSTYSVELDKPEHQKI